MDRRAALMAVMAMPMAQLQLTRDKGVLKIDLGQWTALVVKHGGHEVEIPVDVIFAELTKDDNP